MRRFGLALAVLIPAAGPALADTTSFYMKNVSVHPMVVELFSHDRKAVWPGGDKVYLLDPGEKKSVPIECNAGERICYGAWVYHDDSRRFGVGPDDDRACRDCCRICVDHAIETLELGR